jgi:tocopherol O-methyltransferase
MAGQGRLSGDDNSIVTAIEAEYQSRPSVSVSPASHPVAAYYERKTDSILRRYGPGPRVHFHTGFLDEPATQTTAPLLRAEIRESQERMLRDSADAWDLRNIAFRQVLDVGCGLGGAAIFWAEEFGSDVTAITIAPSHVLLVASFAAEAGVSAQVHPLLCDALEVPGNDRFDAVLSLDSSCYLNRPAWFRRVAEMLRRGGRLFIADCFVEQEAYRAPFDRYWCARIGAVEEYLAEARKAGLMLERRDDVSRLVANFWGTTMALIRLEAQATNTSHTESLKSRESLLVHSLMRRGLLNGGLLHVMMSFTKP